MAKKTVKKAKKKTAKKKVDGRRGQRITPGNELFCRDVAAYPKKSITDIYRDVYGCTGDVANAASSRLMAKKVIKDRIAELQKPVLDNLEVSIERVFAELAAIALVDPLDVYDADGKVKALADIPEQSRRAISSISSFGPKFHNKEKALELLGKTNILNMFTDHIKIDDAPVDESALKKAGADLAKDIAMELKKTTE